MKIFLKFLIVLFMYSSTTLLAQKWRGKTVVTLDKYTAVGFFCDGLAKVKLDKKWGFIDTLGHVIVSPKYEQVENFSEGLARVRSGHHGWGLIDTKGNVIAKPVFDFIGEFVNGLALVRAYGKEGYIDKRGNSIKKEKNVE